MGGQTVYIVYADILFFINFCIDFICLYLSAKLCACPAGIARTALGSALGGLYAVAALALDALPAAAKLPLHLLAAFVICFAAFFRGDWKKTLLCCGLFIAANALMGGLLTAVYTLSGKYAHYNGGFYAEIGAGSLVAIALASALCAWVFGFLSKRRLKSLYADVEIVFGGNRYTLRLLADSGNLLREPISGLPVILLRPGVLPGGEPLTLERPGQRVIPFSSAGVSRLLRTDAHLQYAAERGLPVTASAYTPVFAGAKQYTGRIESFDAQTIRFADGPAVERKAVARLEAEC